MYFLIGSAYTLVTVHDSVKKASVLDFYCILTAVKDGIFVLFELQESIHNEY